MSGRSEFVTTLGCRIQVIPRGYDEHSDKAVLLFTIDSPDDNRLAEVLLTDAEREMLREALALEDQS